MSRHPWDPTIRRHQASTDALARAVEAPVRFANGRWWVATHLRPDGNRWERFWWRWHVRGMTRLDDRTSRRLSHG